MRPANNLAPATPLTSFEMIDCTELGKRWSLPASWVKEQTRSRAADPLPCVRFGKYVRFSWGSPELEQWLTRRYRNGAKASRG